MKLNDLEQEFRNLKGGNGGRVDDFKEKLDYMML